MTILLQITHIIDTQHIKQQNKDYKNVTMQHVLQHFTT